MKRIMTIVVPALFGALLWVTPSFAADSSWLGTWRVSDTQGNPYTIELNTDGTAVGSRQGGMAGKWREIDGNVYIVWKTKWRTLLFLTDNGFGKMSFKPGKTFTSTPDNVTVATRD